MSDLHAFTVEMWIGDATLGRWVDAMQVERFGMDEAEALAGAIREARELFPSDMLRVRPAVFADAVSELSAERDHHEGRVERLRLVAGRPDGLGSSQEENIEYHDGVRYGLDIALLKLRTKVAV